MYYYSVVSYSSFNDGKLNFAEKFHYVLGDGDDDCGGDDGDDDLFLHDVVCL